MRKIFRSSFKDLKNLKLSEAPILYESEELLKYGNDWLKQWPGKAGAVVFPKNTQELLSIVRWAKECGCPLVPSGGRTGLSGGAVALQKELVVSFDKMNQILEFKPFDRSVRVQAGCVTQTLQEFAKEKGLHFPISFAAQGSSQIGGNIATNVGGVHVLRYGNIKNRVLGLEVVTGRGDLLRLGRGLVKNAVGYPLKDLFIGSEGTLGFISEAILSLVSAPEKPQVFLMAVEKSEDLLKLYQEFMNSIPVLAFEFWTDKAVEYVLKHSQTAFPLGTRSPFYALLEIEERESEKTLQLFESFYEKAWVKDGVLSQNLTQAQEIWSLRENISESLSGYQPYKNDVSLRISKMTAFLKDLDKLLASQYPEFENVLFGHLGDGNLHINILKPETWEREAFIKECEKVNETLFSLIQEYEGSISAEHGVGLLKKEYLPYSCSREEIEMMKGIKKTFDPAGILNPGKIFDL